MDETKKIMGIAPGQALPMTYERMCDILEKLKEKYDFLECRVLGRSFFEKSIPILRIGRGEKEVLYVGSHHGMEWVTTTVLLNFAEDLCRCISEGRRVYNMSCDYLFRNRCIYIVPMLNPDGVNIEINGIEDSPIKDRLLKINGGPDFSHWQANGRGVDLNHNYNSGFAEYKNIEAGNGIFGGAPSGFSGEYPESEPETAALCRFIREADTKYVLTLHTQGEVIYWSSCGKSAPHSFANARTAQRLTGYRLSEPEGGASYGGLTDWMIDEIARPSMTIECGLGKNPLPAESAAGIYARIRELLFCSPLLFGL